MEAPGNNQFPIQCRAGCGFYGTSATEGMCSKCYKDYLKKRQTPPSGPSGPSFRNSVPISTPPRIETAVPTIPVITPSTAAPSSITDARSAEPIPDAAASSAIPVGACAIPNVVSPSTSSDPGVEPVVDDGSEKKKKNRCAVCKKKVGLTGFGCRCGGLFCAMHRYSDKHDCSFDYRAHGANEIRRNNPVVKGEKIKQI